MINIFKNVLSKIFKKKMVPTKRTPEELKEYERILRACFSGEE